MQRNWKIKQQQKKKSDGILRAAENKKKIKIKRDAKTKKIIEIYEQKENERK